MVIEDLVDAHRSCLAFDHHEIDVAVPVSAAELGDRGLAGQDMRGVGFACALEARCEVHAVADDRIVHALRRADVSRDNGVGVQADPHVDGLETEFLPLFVPSPELADHGDRRLDGPVRIVLVRRR